MESMDIINTKAIKIKVYLTDLNENFSHIGGL